VSSGFLVHLFVLKEQALSNEPASDRPLSLTLFDHFHRRILETLGISFFETSAAAVYASVYGIETLLEAFSQGAPGDDQLFRDQLKLSLCVFHRSLLHIYDHKPELLLSLHEATQKFIWLAPTLTSLSPSCLGQFLAIYFVCPPSLSLFCVSVTTTRFACCSRRFPAPKVNVSDLTACWPSKKPFRSSTTSQPCWPNHQRCFPSFTNISTTHSSEVVS